LGFKVTEVPTVWRDRTEGTTRFKFFAWLPHYLHWYIYGIRLQVKRFAVANEMIWLIRRSRVVVKFGFNFAWADGVANSIRPLSEGQIGTSWPSMATRQPG